MDVYSLSRWYNTRDAGWCHKREQVQWTVTLLWHFEVGEQVNFYQSALVPAQRHWQEGEAHVLFTCGALLRVSLEVILITQVSLTGCDILGSYPDS